MPCLHNTIVEPDVIVVCGKNRDKITDKRIEGAPDMIIEIVSPGTQSRDYIMKRDLYRRAGVREYWIVDPANKSTVILLQGKKEETTWLFDGEPAPVTIFDGKLTIDFRAYA